MKTNHQIKINHHSGITEDIDLFKILFYRNGTMMLKKIKNKSDVSKIAK